MIRIYCDICNKDTHDEKAPWAVQMHEFKSGQNTVNFHFCETCNKKLLKSIEKLVHDQVTENGQA